MEEVLAIPVEVEVEVEVAMAEGVEEAVIEQTCKRHVLEQLLGSNSTLPKSYWPILSRSTQSNTVAD
jgi:hypothetical protein